MVLFFDRPGGTAIVSVLVQIISPWIVKEKATSTRLTRMSRGTVPYYSFNEWNPLQAGSQSMRKRWARGYEANEFNRETVSKGRGVKPLNHKNFKIKNILNVGKRERYYIFNFFFFKRRE